MKKLSNTEAELKKALLIKSEYIRSSVCLCLHFFSQRLLSDFLHEFAYMLKYAKAKYCEYSYNNQQDKMRSRKLKLYCPLSVQILFRFLSIKF